MYNTLRDARGMEGRAHAMERRGKRGYHRWIGGHLHIGLRCRECDIASARLRTHDGDRALSLGFVRSNWLTAQARLAGADGATNRRMRSEDRHKLSRWTHTSRQLFPADYRRQYPPDKRQGSKYITKRHLGFGSNSPC